jgi:hypothetical protein
MKLVRLDHKVVHAIVIHELPQRNVYVSSQLGQQQTDNNEQNSRWRRDDTVAPEDGAADKALEGVARSCLCNLRERERWG